MKSHEQDRLSRNLDDLDPIGAGDYRATARCVELAMRMVTARA
jgi:hypothetical protein